MQPKIALLAVVMVVLASLCACRLPEMENAQAKFQFLHSFKGPQITDSKGNITYWTQGGSVIPSKDSVRVCPSLRSKRGWIWSKRPLSASNWYIDISLRISGRFKTGADGLAFWVVESPGDEGLTYGRQDTWKGLGVFLDSFDNDVKGDNPKIQVVLNDGTKTYDHRTDGLEVESGSCLKDFRNRPTPVKLRITYLRGILEVWVHDGVSVHTDDYEMCVKIPSEGGDNSILRNAIPKEFFLGASAATGGLSDDHDVISLLTYTLTTIEEKAYQQIMENDTVFEEMNQKYRELSGEFEQRKQDYLKEHPDRAKAAAHSSWSTDYEENEMDMDWQTRMELEASMQVVADMQRALQREIRSVGSKVDVLISGNAGRVAAPASVGTASLTKDMEQIKNTESNILHQLADLRAAMDRSVPAGGKATASEQMQPLYELKNLVSQQSKQLEEFSLHLQELSRNKCPSSNTPPPLAVSCLSPWLFMVVVAVQMFVVIGYTLYSQAQERRAKKFF